MVHEHQGVGGAAGETHFMGDEHHRHARGGQTLEHLDDFAHQFGVERRRDFVEQHQPRTHRERARNGDTLLLAAGQLARIGVQLVFEIDLTQHVERKLPGFE